MSAYRDHKPENVPLRMSVWARIVGWLRAIRARLTPIPPRPQKSYPDARMLHLFSSIELLKLSHDKDLPKWFRQTCRDEYAVRLDAEWNKITRRISS